MTARIRNLGPVSRQWLATIGVETLEELRALGSVDAYRLLLLRGHPVSLNLLWAIEGALLDRHWLELTPGEKAGLRAKLDEPFDAARLLLDEST